MERTTELVTARELAKRLRVAPETVRSWARRGVIPALWLSRKVVRYNPDAVVAALSTNTAKGVNRAE